MKYVTAEYVRAAFKAHMLQYRDEEEADLAADSVPSRYKECWLTEEYRGEVEIDGEEYIKYASYTMFFFIGIHDIPMFRYYTYYRSADIPDPRHSEDFAAAKKLYQLDGLDPDDFPGDMV